MLGKETFYICRALSQDANLGRRCRRPASEGGADLRARCGMVSERDGEEGCGWAIQWLQLLAENKLAYHYGIPLTIKVEDGETVRLVAFPDTKQERTVALVCKGEPIIVDPKERESFGKGSSDI